jgi:dienelactone hydrolase
MLLLTEEKTTSRGKMLTSPQTNFTDLQAQSDEVGITRSQTYFHSLISTEIAAGIPSTRIILGGFSQGGAMAIFSGITSKEKLGGIFGLSCYLLMHQKVQSLLPAEGGNKETRIFMGHGDSDPLVRPEWGQATAKKLKELGFGVELKMYRLVLSSIYTFLLPFLLWWKETNKENRGLEHSADPEEIDDVEKFLNDTIPPLGDQPSL